ncbi:MAG: hypothetical protein IJJ59_05780 [Pseudobutyrivibrio sp.]|uniref:hypothetical protein n=1 Tax=Pseudobutyrivibrio sp. TaxID=2014367 RepID=UPI0025FD13F7|nr:hypothetical protein [Pseudobutyrivibrio sp.]MBQ6462812.1 hypothetical protein [Pseudobutyrivibrio sp.]
MITMLFCCLCIYLFCKMMGFMLRACGGILKIGLYIIAAPFLIGAFIVSGFAVMMSVVCIFAGVVCLLELL